MVSDFENMSASFSLRLQVSCPGGGQGQRDEGVPGVLKPSAARTTGATSRTIRGAGTPGGGTGRRKGAGEQGQRLGQGAMESEESEEESEEEQEFEECEEQE